jgi:putative methyltransferase (TIGR04325 family)
MFWGVYSTFAEAQSAAPRNKWVGYDNEAAASLYRWKVDYMDPSEYAVLYWLEQGLSPGARVFDFGGHVGVKFYAFRSVGALKHPLTWMVYDLPAVVRAGRVLAQKKGEQSIRFTEDISDASGADVFLALGSSQFVEAPLYSILEPLSQLPKVVILSKAPMVDGPRYVTLHCSGVAYHPYLIENSIDLITNMERIGYQLLHRWTNNEKECRILNRPDRSIYRYTSLHFALAA